MDSDQAFPGLLAVNFVTISQQKAASGLQSEATMRGLHTACCTPTSSWLGLLNISSASTVAPASSCPSVQLTTS